LSTQNLIQIVCPTCVGVNHVNFSELTESVGLPHVRGGEPAVADVGPVLRGSSPRAWG